MGKTTASRLDALKRNKNAMISALGSNGAGAKGTDGLAKLAEKASATVAVSGTAESKIVSSDGTIFAGDYVRRVREFQNGAEVRFAVEGTTILSAVAMARNPRQRARAPIVVAFNQDGITKLKAMDYSGGPSWNLGPTITLVSTALPTVTLIPYQEQFTPQSDGTFFLAVFYTQSGGDGYGLVQFFRLDELVLTYCGMDTWADGSPYNVCGDWSPRPREEKSNPVSYTCMLTLAYQCASGVNAGKTYVVGIEPTWDPYVIDRPILIAKIWKTVELKAGDYSFGGVAPDVPTLNFKIPALHTEEYSSGAWRLTALRGDGAIFLSFPSDATDGGRWVLELWALWTDAVSVSGGPEFAFVPTDCKSAASYGGLPCGAMMGDSWSSKLGVGGAIYHAYAVSRWQGNVQKASVALECWHGNSFTLGCNLLYWAEESTLYSTNIGQLSLCWLYAATETPTLCMGYGADRQYRVMAVTLSGRTFCGGPPLPITEFALFAQALPLDYGNALVVYQNSDGGYAKVLKIKDVVMTSPPSEADGIAMVGGNTGSIIQVKFK